MRGFKDTHEVAQALSFFLVFDPPRYANVIHGRHEHQETPRQGNVGGDPGALVPNGLLGHLHEDFLALLEAVLNRNVNVARLQIQNVFELLRQRLFRVLGIFSFAFCCRRS